MSPTGPQDANQSALDAPDPHVGVPFGAPGDLAKRKLLPGLYHLHRAGLLSDCRIVGTSLEELTTNEFQKLAYTACDSFGRGVISGDDWERFWRKITYISTTAGPAGLATAVAEAEA